MERQQSPLFEHEYVSSDVSDTSITNSSSTTTAGSEISPYFKKLLAIEENARAALADWNESNIGSTIPTKRPVSEVLIDSDIDSDEEKDTSDIPPVDPTKRRRPKLPLYHPGFRQAEKDVSSILQVFIDFLGMAANGGEEAEYLQNQALKNRSISYQEEIRFAVTGDTGSGKSATTNALLGDDLTPEGDSGSACTNVVTEFRPKTLTTNVGAVQAEVQFYCREYCVDLVTSWFKEWFSIHQRTIQDENEVDDHERARKDAALECMNHLFAHRAASDSLENFMSSSKSSNDTLNKLLTWTIEIHEQFISDGDLCVHLTSSTHNDMREQLRLFRMCGPNARFKGKLLTFSPWPFVEIIRYYIDSPLLQDGICLADVPGAMDINMYRVTAAEAYLQQCEKTIVVVDIKRAASDQSFRQHYIDAHRRRHHGSIILVATRSDEMNDDGGSTLQLDAIGEKQLAPIEEELHARNDELLSIDNDLEANKHEIKRIKIMAQKGKANEDHCEALREAKRQTIARRKTLVSLIASLEKDRKNVRITCRNRIVATDLDRMYSQNTGDDTGVSFCVSNRMYMRHRRGYNLNSDRVPSMRLEDTQIPVLFDNISGQPSQGKVAVLEHFIQFKIPMLLSIFQVSCSKSTEARVDHITKILDQAIDDIRSNIKSMAQRCIDTSLKDLTTSLSHRELQDTFDQCAERALENIAEMNAASHRALVRKNGKYHVKKRNIKHDLNATLLSSITPTIESVFRDVIDTTPKSFKAQAAQTIRSSFNQLNKTLKDDPQALAGDAYQLCFGNHLAGYDKDVGLRVEAAAKKFRQGLIDVSNKASKPTEKGYLHEAMVPIYQQAESQRPQKRQKLKDVRHDYLKENIPCLDGPFSKIAERTDQDVKAIISDTCRELHTGVIGILKGVREAFERQKHRKENDTPERQRFRKELHDLVAEALRIMKGVVTESLEKCKEHK